MIGSPSSKSWGRGVVVALFLAIVAIAFALYAGSLKNEFVWDDPIVLGQQLQAFHSLPEIFFPPPRIPQFGRLYYRPMIVLSYVIDRWMWGDTPFGFHFPVVLLHALNSGLVFLIGRRLFGGSPGALLASFSAGLLFATHPIHTESVCWMAGRSDTLAAVFLLPALLAYLAWKRRRSAWIYLVLACVLYLAGCLTKESALGMLFIVAVADILGVGIADEAPQVANRMKERVPAAVSSPGAGSRTRSKERRKERDAQRTSGTSNRSRMPGESRPGRGFPLAGWAALAATTIVYLVIRQKGLEAEPGKLYRQNPDLVASSLNLIKAVGFYVSKIFVPVHLDAYIPQIPHPQMALALGFASLGAAAILFWLAWSWGEKLIALFIAWFFGALAPSLAIAWFSISEAPVAERYLYLPSAAFCLLAGYLAFVKLPALLPAEKGRKALDAGEAVLMAGGNGQRSSTLSAAAMVLAVSGIAVFALTVTYGAATLQRERVWRADFDFWTDGVAKSPNEGLPHLHLGLALANLGDKQRDNPSERLRLRNLAEKEYLLAIDPQVEYDVEGRSTALNNLGMLNMGEGDFDKADEYFDQSIRMRPDYATPHYGLGVTSLRRGEDLSRQGKKEEASQYLKKAEQSFKSAIEFNPQYVKAHNQLAYLLARTGRTGEARQHLDLVLRLVGRGPEHDFAAKLAAELPRESSQ